MKKIDFNGSEHGCCTTIQEVQATACGKTFEQFKSIEDMLKAWVGRDIFIPDDPEDKPQNVPIKESPVDEWIGEPAGRYVAYDEDGNCVAVTLFKVEDLIPDEFELEYIDGIDGQFQFFMEDEGGQVWFVQCNED